MGLHHKRQPHEFLLIPGTKVSMYGGFLVAKKRRRGGVVNFPECIAAILKFPAEPVLGVYGERGCPCRTYCVVSPRGELLSYRSGQLGACSPVQGAVQGFSRKYKSWVYIIKCSRMSSCPASSGDLQSSARRSTRLF